MPDLLLELFSEEIPARMQQRAAKDLERMMNERLLSAGFLPEGVKAFAGPRRLALIATGLPLRQPDRVDEKKGPRVGAPEQAIKGFLKSAGLSSLDQCAIVEDKKGAYYVAKIEEKGLETSDVLGEAVPAIIREFPWPKSMRWGDGDLRWVRPLQSVLCCFNDEIVPFEINGLKSGDATRGHRRYASGPIHARNFDKYVLGLTNAKVILDGRAREEMIAADARTLCEAQGLELVEDKGLLGEVAGLAEWPVVMIGSFDPKFLALPDEALTASMRGHQKYFSVRDPRTGRLAAKFVFVANIDALDAGKAMRAGYERVLTARLSDAWYLYHQDLKIPLEDRVKDLDRVTFFEGLGSIGDKARRIAALAKEIAPAVGADPALAEKAALLAKADLTTGMVYEFPELQGLMGRYYYLAQRASPLSRKAAERDKAIADAIRDHYKPLGADDDVPTAPVSVAAALAEKIDTLTAFWAIGKEPTGSSDPFALRRAALGVILTTLRSKTRIGLDKITRSHVPWLSVDDLSGPSGSAIVEAELSGGDLIFDYDSLIGFFHDRLKVYLKDKGHKYDAIDAVLAKADGSLEDDLVLIVMKLESLEAFLKTEDGANLAAGYKRAANILKAEEKKGKLPEASAVEAALLQQAEEKALFAALTPAEEKAEKAVAAEKFAEAMTALASLRAPIDAFFDKVTVNADDAKLRANRLALLKRFIAATASVADLSKLEG
jgi:glycyl-tRNA synthetase beta chain